ncbi:MAG: sulfotransferase [Rhizobiaceae bacterium]
MAKTAAEETIFDVPRLSAFGSRLLARHGNALAKLASLESRFLDEQIDTIDISQPIFVCGLARSGTTVLLEMLSHHPDTASQRYLDYPFVFTPYWWNRFVGLAARKPPELGERSHKDGLMVSAESPEAMEEPLWMHFFSDCHDASTSNVMDHETSNAEFEGFYKKHMAKLLMVRDRSRYLAKGNYHIARIGYLHKLFPDARFVIPVRDPAMHIASSMKQHKLFAEGQQQSSDARLYLAQIGHYEFGLDRSPINIDRDQTEEIIGCWSDGEEVRGWALYWSMIHNHIADVVGNSTEIGEQTTLLSYKALCADPADHCRMILSRCGLDNDDEMIDWAENNIHAQQYYKPSFSEQELQIIEDVTSPAYNRVKPLFQSHLG